MVFGYKPRKGFSISTADGNNSLTLGGRVQLRYTGADKEDDDDESTFRVRRMRIWTEGHVYNPNWRYGFQGDFAGSFSLRDVYVQSTHRPQARVKLGQYKIPHNRRQMTSSGALQFCGSSGHE
ncbi:MAG: hypothetical protein KatS3mg077_0545 [Candidatus Binatia bacterium]|nr:MAG: hypothetical protein KatS3mg077_0545 [Candidatus Binatia bacterium]